MLKFNTVILHNFSSYSHAEVDLQNKGFCLVSGENHHIKDNTTSNGTGKSTLWSAICFALTGETLTGLKSNLKNIYNTETDAYVTLDFNVCADHYVITRIIAPKSDLKILKNSIDVSGKGIRDSEQKLTEFLPDITQELLSSSILLGQGMPNKFSSFKPSGRKELLEKLTKSDFMIEDIKNRINTRTTELSTKIRELEDRTLINNTKLNTYLASLATAQAKLSSAIKPNFEIELKTLSEELNTINNTIDSLKKSVLEQEKNVDKTNADLLLKTNEKATLTQKLYENYTAATADIKAKKVTIETQLAAAKAKAKKFNDNPDRCPTCGQKLPNAEHILKEKETIENEIKQLSEQLAAIMIEIAAKDKQNTEYTEQIKKTFESDIANLTAVVSTTKASLTKTKSELDKLIYDSNKIKEVIAAKTNLMTNWDSEQAVLKTTITDLEKLITELTTDIKSLEETKLDLNNHLQRVHWLETLTKRDFRGYILTDIIKYLDLRAKAYAKIVFKHDDLNIYLDGNDLDISYSGKMFDSLSGGEKQCVDLIIQFAIRDLLATYMDIESNIIVLDEVYDNLDAKATENINNLIANLNTIESVFVISHHADSLNLSYDTELHVYKNADGISSVIQK